MTRTKMARKNECDIPPIGFENWKMLAEIKQRECVPNYENCFANSNLAQDWFPVSETKPPQTLSQGILEMMTPALQSITHPIKSRPSKIKLK
jgi:hypothetical protein